jgi:hypothetical protein
MPKICYKMVKIRHKLVRNPEENFATTVLIFGIFYRITIVERFLTDKLLTGIFPPIRYIIYTLLYTLSVYV